MRFVLAATVLLVASTAASAQTCFKDCLATKIDQNSDDIAVKDAARACGRSCEDKNRRALEQTGAYDKVKDCKAEPLSFDDFKKVRAASPSFYVQSNVFIWDAKNPFDDRVITRIEVSAQNLDLNEMQFTGVGLVPPDDGVGTFVIPGFYDGYPGARLGAKIKQVWACPIK